MTAVYGSFSLIKKKKKESHLPGSTVVSVINCREDERPGSKDHPAFSGVG